MNNCSFLQHLNTGKSSLYKNLLIIYSLQLAVRLVRDSSDFDGLDTDGRNRLWPHL